MFERFSRQARIAVVVAQEEARELHADEIRPEHLLLGVLSSAGDDLAAVLGRHGLTAASIRTQLTRGFDDDAAALQSIGIDLHAVRDTADESFGAGAFDRALRGAGRRRRRHIPFVKPAKKALELALREAVAHHDRVIDAEHLLLGILRGGDEVTLEVIGAHVSPQRLRADVAALLARAA
ncbi:Clp protease [Mycobacterium sp. PS03-16]|uniref:Clp protease N-terminal domain-containing protein n=1 Tax=Mycobacterium sp. PS03-16 TaxID=2559611 RepID=UPI00107341A1|nr:Clp protease N-terminal domain-containing protein [Mycobacterium sp. PS03-16]TFV61372.1 Clp protease [Mycobacterium sp. PS03-16]